MSEKWTPGPLHVQQDSARPYQIRICDKTGKTIHSEPPVCSSSRWNSIDDARNLVGIHGDERKEWQRLMDRQMADLQLRAAAPDLAVAVVYAIDQIENHRDNAAAQDCVLLMLRAALSRARGDQS